MRSTVNVMIGLGRDPVLLCASFVLALGLAVIALMSVAIAWRLRPGRCRFWVQTLGAQRAADRVEG